MRPIRAAAAVARLKTADRALTENGKRERAAGVAGETPEFNRLNRAVNDAYWDPDLPAIFRDPQDR